MTDPYAFEMPKPITLNLDQVGANLALPSGVYRANARVNEDFITAQLVTSIRAFVLSEHLANDTESASTKVPATWWDHAKLDLYNWAVRLSGRRWKLVRRAVLAWVDRHPVDYRRITLSVTWSRRATRPESTIAIPDKLGPVVYQEASSVRWNYGEPS